MAGLDDSGRWDSSETAQRKAATVRGVVATRIASSPTKLKNHLQGKLHHARRPSTIDLTVTEIILVAPAGAAKGRRTIKVRNTAAGESHSFPLRMVEVIERLPAELQGGVFTLEPGQLELLEQGEVPVIATGPVRKFRPT
jgi:hypothetical protein